MAGEVEWCLVEDSNPENRELGEVIRRLEGADYEIGGGEHLVVRVDEQPDRVFKLTHGDCFLNFESRILLTDAAPRNVRIVDGTPALFDVIASFASEQVYEWAVSLHGRQ